jgi:predicted nucleic acid-binding protein
MLRFLDTNVLLYSVSRDPAEVRQQERAVALLLEDDLALSVQVLQEFYVQATRGSRSDPLPHDLAAELIRTWMRFPVQEATLRVHEAALEIEAAHGLGYWDSAIVAAAQALGCQELHTEEIDHGRQFGAVTVVNPFR